MATANPEDRARTCSKGFLEEAPSDLGPGEARFRHVEKWGMRTWSRERRAGINKAQVKCPCLTTADCQELWLRFGTAAHQACRAKAALPHHLTAGTYVRSLAALEAQLSGCGRVWPPGRREEKQVSQASCCQMVEEPELLDSESSGPFPAPEQEMGVSLHVDQKTAVA